MYRKLYGGTIAVSPGTLLYTVPVDSQVIVKDIIISNTTALPLTCLLYFVSVGDSPATANTVIPNVSIAANSILQVSCEQFLGFSDYIQGIGSGAGLVVRITGDVSRK